MGTSRRQAEKMPDVWAVVLAGGDGTRLATRTRRANGQVVPKQYCRLATERTLLETTLDRLEPIAAPQRTVVVVAAHHAPHWHSQRHDVPDANILVQPANRGTTMGLLLALMHIRLRDPHAHVVVVPADHGVIDESLFRWRLLDSIDESRHGLVIVLGMVPDGDDADYGWIVPGPALRRDGSLHRVSCFVEKPSEAVAKTLRANGGVWSSFVMTARLGALLALVAEAQPALFSLAIAQLHSDRGFEPECLARFYDLVPVSDFSRDVLSQLPDALWVATVEPCGWSDLGTPERLDRFLHARQHATVVTLPPVTRTPTASDLTATAS